MSVFAEELKGLGVGLVEVKDAITLDVDRGPIELRLGSLKLVSQVRIQEFNSVDFMLLGLQVSTLVQLDNLSHQLVEDLTVFLKASLMVTAALLLLTLILRGKFISYRRFLVTSDQGLVKLGTSDST